jgi:hypothetical protein
MPAIAELGAEHERLLDLGGRVRRAIAAGDAAAGRRTFDDLVAILRVHTAVEEAGLLTELRAEGELDEHVAALLDDHRSAWAAVDAVGRSAGADWEAATGAFLDDLDSHIRREEHDLFPASIPALSPAAWERVAAARQRVPTGRPGRIDA